MGEGSPEGQGLPQPHLLRTGTLSVGSMSISISFPVSVWKQQGKPRLAAAPLGFPHAQEPGCAHAPCPSIPWCARAERCTASFSHNALGDRLSHHALGHQLLLTCSAPPCNPLRPPLHPSCTRAGAAPGSQGTGGSHAAVSLFSQHAPGQGVGSTYPRTLWGSNSCSPAAPVSQQPPRQGTPLTFTLISIVARQLLTSDPEPEPNPHRSEAFTQQTPRARPSP